MLGVRGGNITHMGSEYTISKIRRQILRNIESNEESDQRYLVSTFALWKLYIHSKSKKCDPNKEYRIHQDSLALLLQEGYIENPSKKQLSDSEIKLTPKGREYLNNHKSIDVSSITNNLWLVGVGTAVIAGLILYYIFGIGKQSKVITNFPIDRTSVETLSSLNKPSEISIGINYQVVKASIGEATFKNLSEDDNYIEYIYLFEGYILQIIVDSNDKIQAFSFTTEDKKMTLKTYNYDVTLGMTTLSEAKEGLSRCYGFIGANGPSYYFEEHYLGRPGKYLYYYTGAIKPLMGILDIKPLHTLNESNQNRYKPLQEYDCKNISDKDRDSFVISTMMYSSLPLENLPFLPGPDTEQLNLLN